MKLTGSFPMVRAIACLLLAASALLGQDRNIQVNEVYPAHMRMTFGGPPADFSRRIINVRQLPPQINGGISAVGDGVNDDSDAIIAAMTWVMKRLRDGESPPVAPYWEEYWTVYIPDGIYKVTKPLVYSGAVVPYPYPASNPNNEPWEGTCRLMLVGQSREGTRLKVADGPGVFDDPNDPKPVVAFSRFDLGTTFNNIVGGNHFRNFTIDVGTTHPGAIGVDFTGANNARMDNLLIMGEGKYGIHHRIGTAHGYYSNITVVGMDYGIYMGAQIEESHPTYEYVTLTDQNIAGIYQSGISATFRKVLSMNSVPAVKLVANNVTIPGNNFGQHQPHLVIVDSQFLNGAAGNTVFALGDASLAAGFLFARNITVSGYGSTVTRLGSPTVAGSIQEYVSAPISSFTSRVSTSAIKSMNLPVADYPVLPWIDPVQSPLLWANVDNYPTIQAAMDSGRPVVYFPGNSYTLTATVTIPASVKRIIGAQALLNVSGITNQFNINQASSDVLLVHGLNLKGAILQTAARDVLLESTSGRGNLYDSDLAAGGTRVFVNNTNNFASLPNTVTNVSAWVRWNDNEKNSDNQFNADPGSTHWMLGFKSEKTWVVFQASGNSRFEILGGVLSQMGGGPKDPDPFNLNSLRPGLISNSSQFSITAATIGIKTFSTHHWDPLIRDIQSGQPTLNLAQTNTAIFPLRGWNQNVILPLYASYVPVDAQVPAAPLDLSASPGTTSVALHWSSSTAATSYKLYRSTTSNGQGSPLVSGLLTTSYTDTGLTSGTTYYYKVKAGNGAGDGAFSGEASARPAAALIPAAPTSLGAFAGNQQVTLAWNASSGATSYNLYRSTTSNGQGGTPVVTNILTTTYVNTGLTNGVTYYYKVAAVNANGVSTQSGEAGATPAVVPVKLTPVAATASDSEAANPPSKAIDNNMTQRWSASVLSCPPTHWLQVDLGSAQTVSMVKTYFYSLTYTYNVQVSTDNVNFTTVAPSRTTTTPNQWETDAFAPVSARYVRINITAKVGGAGTKPGIVEAEVYN